MQMEQDSNQNQPHVWISEFTFSDGKAITLEKSDIVVIVGPNNSGKSATLRTIRQKIQDVGNLSPVVSSIKIQTEGTTKDLFTWLQTWTTQQNRQNPGRSQYAAFGASASSGNIESWWKRPESGFRDIARWFCHMLTADERLQISNPTGSINMVSDAPIHPIHFLYRDNQLEQKLSTQFRKAFGLDLIVHHGAGTKIPLYTGERPLLQPGEDLV